MLINIFAEFWSKRIGMDTHVYDSLETVTALYIIQ